MGWLAPSALTVVNTASLAQTVSTSGKKEWYLHNTDFAQYSRLSSSTDPIADMWHLQIK